MYQNLRQFKVVKCKWKQQCEGDKMVRYHFVKEMNVINDFREIDCF